MKNRFLPAATAAFFCAFALFSCDVTQPDEFIPEYIVESYLYANEPLPEVRLSRTVALGAAYVFEEQAVSGADVFLRLLDKDGRVEREYAYAESGKGIYRPRATDATVLPARSYALEVAFPGDDMALRSTTIVPDTFSVVSASNDSVVYQAAEQLEIEATPSFYPGRQNVFIFSIESLDPRFEQLTPFRRDMIEREGGEHSLEDFEIDESLIVNEANFDPNPGGTITIKIPWIAIAFYGPNIININAIDGNVLDFIRSQRIQRRAPTLSPGEIPNIIDNIEGGTGLFGSFARVRVQVFVEREN